MLSGSRHSWAICCSAIAEETVGRIDTRMNGILAAARTKVMRIAFLRRFSRVSRSTSADRARSTPRGLTAVQRRKQGMKIALYTADLMRTSIFRGPGFFRLVLLTTIASLAFAADNSAAPRRPQPSARPKPRYDALPPPPPAITAGTRLLVVAPHPDDEVLAAGGLMQQVREAGGQVRVVY